ncbi:putative glutathione S-transferase [Obelidium mucronatum]|nr:putative glutathione S-transferase [Obelidium mucronatum]
MPSVLGNEKPIFTYWNLPARGRGEVNRLFFAEAGIEFEDVRVDFPDWPAKKADLVKSGKNHYGALPLLQIGDVILTQHIPILRYVSKKLGKYGGSNDEEAYKLDQFSDVAIDWRFSFAKEKETHPQAIPRFYNTFENLLAGPFVLGEEFSYADAILYQALQDDGSLGNEERLAAYPRLQKFIAALEARPRIAAYLSQRKELYGV